MGDSSLKNPGIRWWPAAIVAAGGTTVLVWVWTSDGGRTGQDRVLMSYPIAVVTVLLLAIWLVFLSRLSRRVRLLAATLGLAMLAFAGVTIRVRGVTGDLAPILEWRWTSRVPTPIEAPPPTASPSAADAPIQPPVAPVAEGATSAPRADRPLASVAPTEAPIATGEFPQFLGASRNGSVSGVRLADDWAAVPPPSRWRTS